MCASMVNPLVWGLLRFAPMSMSTAACLFRSLLQEMQQGVNDVLPSSAFDNLTAEDLHLLMNGSPVVDVEVLKKITSFMDESRECHMTVHCHFPCLFCAVPLVGVFTFSPRVPLVTLTSPTSLSQTNQPNQLPVSSSGSGQLWRR